MTEPVLTPLLGMRALARLRFLAQKMKLPGVFDVVRLVVSTVPTACWVKTPCGEREIHVNFQFALDWDESPLQGLLAHELLHDLGFSEDENPIPGSRELNNWAYDLSLERALDATVYGPDIRRLNQRLMRIRRRGPLTPAESLGQLLLPRPPLHRMPAAFRGVHAHLWDRRQPAPTPQAVYQQLVGLGIRETLPPVMKFMGTVILQTGIGHEGCSIMRYNPETDLVESGTIYPRCSFILSDDVNLRAEVGSLLNRPGNRSQTAAPQWLGIRLVPPDTPSSQSIRRIDAWWPDSTRLRLHRYLDDVIGPGHASTMMLPYLLRPTSSALVKAALGWPTLYSENNSFPRSRRLALFVDVSSSMNQHLSAMVGVIRAVQNRVSAKVFTFDDTVRETNR